MTARIIFKKHTAQSEKQDQNMNYSLETVNTFVTFK